MKPDKGKNLVYRAVRPHHAMQRRYLTIVDNAFEIDAAVSRISPA